MTYKLVLDKQLVNEYQEYYFKQHPRAKKCPIDKPCHPSLNVWCILPRIQMNTLKQQWKDFGVFWIKKLGYENLKLDSFDVVVTIFFDSRRRHDVDNFSEKFLWDSFTESGFIVDDDDKHMHSLTIKTGYDKENPRTEIEIITCTS